MYAVTAAQNLQLHAYNKIKVSEIKEILIVDRQKNYNYSKSTKKVRENR